MAQQKYPKAYEAYQQAVYRDGKNPTFWCSIGVLYYQINQYRDALDAYSRAIRLNPYISEVWYDLGTLVCFIIYLFLGLTLIPYFCHPVVADLDPKYESCNNQIADALDAYQRAAELDPGNPHIKARLQLLRSGGSNGSGQAPAPQPADVHPQAYQAAGPSGPVGPQWGGSAQQPPAGGPPQAPAGAGDNWAGRLSNVNPPPQPPNPYENRGEPFRGPPPPPQRQPSPPQDQQMRQGGYPEPRGAVPPGPSRRGPSPAPAGHQYGQPPPPPPSQGPNLGDRRVANPNWGGPPPSSAGPPSNSANGANTPSNGAAPFRPTSSPRGEIRPHDNRMPSPKTAYPQHPGASSYPPHHPEGPPPSVPENGPPPGAGPDAAVQRPDDRPPSVGPKRMREWEEESVAKKQANEENRARLDDMRHRRPSTPPRDAYRRNSNEARRSDEQRRPEEPKKEEARPQNDSYYPSEAAHHPQNHSISSNQLPPMQPGNLAPGGPQDKTQPGPPTKEERPASEQASTVVAPLSAEPERAARKMDVDEDYDDSPEEDKKTGIVANGSGPPSGSGDVKTTSPASASVNGTSGTATKTE